MTDLDKITLANIKSGLREDDFWFSLVAFIEEWSGRHASALLSADPNDAAKIAAHQASFSAGQQLIAELSELRPKKSQVEE